MVDWRGFTRIGSPECCAWESVPVISSTQSALPSETDPSHILLMAWTGAQRRYLASYKTKYTELFPHSRIIVVFTSPWDFCFRSSKRKQDLLAPLVDHLRYYEQNAELRLLLHAFSEGGSNKATLLAEAYHKHSGCRLPVDALCLDSTPGHPSFKRLRHALSKSLPPQPLLKHAGFAVGSIVVAGKFVYYMVFTNFDDNPISKTRRQLLNADYFNPKAPRCYLYSISDRIVAWKDIKQHLYDSIDGETPVTEIVFDKTEHCKHARAEPERYWKGVMQVWQKAILIKTVSSVSGIFGEEKASVVESIAVLG